MAWDLSHHLTGVRRVTVTSDDQGCDGLKVQTYGEPGRHGPRARNVPLGGNGTLIPVMLMIGITVAAGRSLTTLSNDATLNGDGAPATISSVAVVVSLAAQPLPRRPN